MRQLALLLGLIAASPATGQALVTSTAPERVSVGIYRAPDRPADREIDRDDPQGYALVTETRTVALPAGPAVIRFEGVAGNIFPESAIVSGLPASVAEKNLDAALLSPRSLFDRSLGRRVLVRRTDPATGGVREEQAVIRSSADGAAVLQVAGGYEALRCSGLPEGLVYDGVPEGLSARPTLSVATNARVPARVKVTLTYLAGGFDWQPDYVVRMRPDGRGAELFGWLTLASSDVTSFSAASTQVIAGKPNREAAPLFGRYGPGALHLRCPAHSPRDEGVPPPPPPPPAPPPPAPAAMLAEDVVVTGMRARKAVQEELGDLKLYRVADPVTVASKAQKQVAFLSREAVALVQVYLGDVFEGEGGAPVLALRGRNRTEDGLGVPLPAGRAVVFEQAGGAEMLVGESSLADKAVGEELELRLGETPGVSARIDTLEERGRRTRYRLTVSNANPWPIAYEARIGAADGATITSAVKLSREDGRSVWHAQVPANGTAELGYTVRRPR